MKNTPATLSTNNGSKRNWPNEKNLVDHLIPELMGLLSNKYFLFTLKVLAFILLSWVVYTQYNKLDSNPQLLAKISVFFNGNHALGLSLILIALVLLNYLIESFKWKIILKPIQSLSLSESFKGILTGVLFSIFTPARVGELGGRVLNLGNENRLVGSAAVLVGSIAQNISILLLGLLGFVYFIDRLAITDPLIIVSICVLSLFLIGFLLIVFFNIEKFIPVARKLPFPKMLRPYLIKFRHLSDYSSNDLFRILLLSIIRISIWTFQYLVIMNALTGNIPVFNSIAVIWIIFLVQTGIPLPPISGLIARSGVAVYMWSLLMIDEWNALTATFVIYFYNLIIPSCVGLFVLIFNRKNLNENV